MHEFDEIQLSANGLGFSALSAAPKTSKEKATVLLLHGFPDLAESFIHQLKELSAAGYRAIAPTMRGYEPSSQPAESDYSVMALASDVVSWMDDLGQAKVHLVGHDWGAVASYAAAALHPNRFYSLSTLAVPFSPRFLEALPKVPVQYLNSWYMLFFQLAGVSDSCLAWHDWALIRKLWRNWSPGYQLDRAEWEALRRTFERPGVTQAALSYYRQNTSPSVILGMRTPEAALLKTLAVPTLAMTGEQDGCIDTRLYDHTFFAHDFPEGFRIERITNAGHFLHREQPQRINQLLLEWFDVHNPCD